MAFLVIWIVMGFIGMAIGSSKGRGGFGFLMGLLLGFIGWIIVAVMPEAKQAPTTVAGTPTNVVCPHCRAPIDRRASVCATCRRDVKPSA